MKDQFVPYNLAVKLKELGLAFECVGYYYNQIPFSGEWKLDNRIWDSPNSDYLEAPLWQQAFDWFRNKYNLNSVPEKGSNPVNYYPVVNNESHKYNRKLWFDTYEEARQACLEKLIEIVENGK